MEVSKEASKLESENFLISSDIEKFRLFDFFEDETSSSLCLDRV